MKKDFFFKKKKSSKLIYALFKKINSRAIYQNMPFLVINY